MSPRSATNIRSSSHDGFSFIPCFTFGSRGRSTSTCSGLCPPKPEQGGADPSHRGLTRSAGTVFPETCRQFKDLQHIWSTDRNQHNHCDLHRLADRHVRSICLCCIWWRFPDKRDMLLAPSKSSGRHQNSCCSPPCPGCCGTGPVPPDPHSVSK